jgi:hypothetical protein
VHGGGGVRELITTTTSQQHLHHPVATDYSIDLVSCWRPGLVPCADWGVFDEVRVRYAGVHTPETVARSLSSTHNPRSACCCHSPMYIPLLAADMEKIFRLPYNHCDIPCFLLQSDISTMHGIDARLSLSAALDHYQHPRLR